MKKFNYFLVMFVMFVLCFGSTKASAEVGKTDKITLEAVNISYYSDLMVVSIRSNEDEKVYYQMVKSESSTVRSSAWIEVTAVRRSEGDNGTDDYYIDLSGISNTRTGYIALTSDPKQTKPDCVVTIKASIKSFNVTLDYDQEEVSSLYDIIKKIEIKDVEGKTTTLPTNDTSISDKYILGWKKGVNGRWREAGELDTLTWNMIKDANAAVYVRIEGIPNEVNVDELGTIVPIHYTKEVKLKIPRVATAPSIKIDYVKGTISLKNGMQFQDVTVSKDNDGTVKVDQWIDVYKYNKTSTNKVTLSTDVPQGTTTLPIDTQTRVTSVSIDDLLEACGLESVYGKEVVIAVRQSATDKTLPSKITYITFTTPEQKLVGDDSKFATAYTYVEKTEDKKASLSFDITKALKAAPEDLSQYEYLLVSKSAIVKDGEINTDTLTTIANSARNKWTKFSGSSAIDLSAKVGRDAIFYLNTTKNTVGYEEVDAILIRKSSVKEVIKKGTVTTKGELAGEILCLLKTETVSTPNESEETK